VTDLAKPRDAHKASEVKASEQVGDNWNMRGRPKRRVGHNLLLRLHAFQADVLRFLSHLEVPFTNNQAERDLRMMKLKQKISGGFRSPKGASDFACIRSVLSTARKQGLNLLELIQSALCSSAPLLN